MRRGRLGWAAAGPARAFSVSIETGLQILDLTRFLDANRSPLRLKTLWMSAKPPLWPPLLGTRRRRLSRRHANPRGARIRPARLWRPRRLGYPVEQLRHSAEPHEPGGKVRAAPLKHLQEGFLMGVDDLFHGLRHSFAALTGGSGGTASTSKIVMMGIRFGFFRRGERQRGLPQERGRHRWRPLCES